VKTDHQARGSRKSIFCIEDDQDTCAFLSILLKDYDFNFTPSVVEATARIRQRSDDLYILDNWLPDGTGIDVCRDIRQIYPYVPIIFTSAAARELDIRDGLAAGANHYLLKPFEPEELRRIVKELLKE
jgi:two-component system OmpR family response regulator